MLARLRHPNLILFMGYCTMPELCIVSEYMSKGSLYSVLHSPEQRKQRLLAAQQQQKQQPALEAATVGSEGQQQGSSADGSSAAASSSTGGTGAGASRSSRRLQVMPSQEFELQQQFTPEQERLAQMEALEPKLQRLVAISVARGMAYLHTRNPPILHLVSSRW